jgi:DNA-binding NarL/FixJ family response regulator
VLLARDGVECVQIYERDSDRIQLVILDLCMPKMSGEEALQKIRALQPEARIIISSGHTSYEPPSLCGPFQPSGYLSKPFTHVEMANVVRSILDGHPACND